MMDGCASHVYQASKVVINSSSLVLLIKNWQETYVLP